MVLVAGGGFRGLASVGPFLGAPAGSPGQVKYTGGTGSGAWHPLTPSWVPFRGVSCHSSWSKWRWFSLCLLSESRSWYASATDHAGSWWVRVRVPVLWRPQVQFLDKVAALQAGVVRAVSQWCMSSVGFAWGFQ